MCEVNCVFTKVLNILIDQLTITKDSFLLLLPFPKKIVHVVIFYNELWTFFKFTFIKPWQTLASSLAYWHIFHIHIVYEYFCMPKMQFKKKNPEMSFNERPNMFFDKIISCTCDLHLKLNILNSLIIIFYQMVLKMSPLPCNSFLQVFEIFVWFGFSSSSSNEHVLS
jgi:hypothetical protein